jgi:formimidoylglutamate deiminase
MTKQTFFCSWLLGPDGWLADQLMRVDSSGRIEAIEAAGQNHADKVVRLDGPVIPGMCNLHSHAHQRLIAGLTGRRGADEDSFWSWREQMYRALALLGPDDLHCLASWLYIELMEGGYTTIGEFHYPHRLSGSSPLASSQALLAAAETAACGLTLLPVWYRYAGFGRQAPEAMQQGFVLGPDEFRALVVELTSLVGDSDRLRVGIAPHSLRAVDVADLPALTEDLAGMPIHIHVAEQPAEVSACLAASGRRPIELLADHVELGPRWCLIHATHANSEEISLIGRSGATVGLCPTTEADLGDGLFPMAELRAAGGRWGIGSDSNLITSAASELRLLEWGQRLLGHQRNRLAPVQGGHLGAAMWAQAAQAGADALAQPAGRLSVGKRADWVVLNTSHPLLEGLGPDAQLDTLIMAEQPGMIDAVFVNGRPQVVQGRHRCRGELSERFTALRRRLARDA